MPMFLRSRALPLLLLSASWACATQTIGGGGGLAAGPIASGGAPGAPCQPTSQGEGCRFAPGPVRMKCDAATSTWVQVEACAAGQACLEALDPTPGAGAKKLTVCKMTAVVGTDGAATAADGGASDGFAPGDATGPAADAGPAGDSAPGSDTNVPGDTGLPDSAPDTPPPPDTAKDAPVPDLAQPDLTEPDLTEPDLSEPDVPPLDAKPDACKPACAGKECGPDGCGGVCNTCTGGLQCDAGKCKAVGGGLGLGVSCFGKTQSCISGSQCVANASIDDYVCLPNQAAGKACGPGVGFCAVGSDCVFADDTKAAFKCAPQNGGGQACALYGSGFCQPGSQCIYTSTAFKTLKCIADVGLDEPCGEIGKGLCGTGLECVSVAKGIKSYVCKAQAALGGTCGPGVGGCEDPAECVWASAAQTQAKCYAPGGIGATCGDYAAPEACGPWLKCNEAASGANSGTCLPMKVAGQPCGYGVGWCANFLICGPKDATSGKSICLPLGGKDATCGPGVGYCFSGYECSAPDLKTMGKCIEKCATQGLYSNGTCDTGCNYNDPDCAP